MQLCYIILHFITHFQSSSSSVTAKSPVYKFSIQNTTEWAFAEARRFRFLVITFPALENKRSLATDVAGTASNRLATAATDRYFGHSSPTRTVDFGCAKVSARRGKLLPVDAWSVATRHREWQTTLIQHCWTWRHSVCPTGSTTVWDRLQMQWMQWTTAVRHLKWMCFCTFVNSTVESLHRRGAHHWRAFLIQTQFTGSPTHHRWRPYLFAFDFISWWRCYVQNAQKLPIFHVRTETGKKPKPRFCEKPTKTEPEMA